MPTAHHEHCHLPACCETALCKHARDVKHCKAEKHDCPKCEHCNDRPIQKPDVTQQIMASSAGVTCAMFVVLPFDVMKVRNQASGNPLSVVFKNIWKNEGVSGFYRGIRPSLAMAIPSASAYFVAYDNLRMYLGAHAPSESWVKAAPPAAAFSARMLTAVVTAPMELVRTNMMSTDPAKGAKDDWLKTTRRLYTAGGFRSFYAGLGATLARDAPYSALYWGLFDTLKRIGYDSGFVKSGDKGASSLLVAGAGVVSGMVASGLTTPFDVIKTHQQMEGASRGSTMASVVRSVMAQRGVPGLFAGLGPRLIRVAPASAVMMTTMNLMMPNRG